MITKIEMQYMEAVKTIAQELRKANADKEPDWELRRYEVARELFPVLVQIKHNGTGIRNITDVNDLAVAAVDGANALIRELRNTPIPE